MSKRWAIAGLVAAIIIPRLSSLGRVLTIDEPLWVGRGANFIHSFSTFDLLGTRVAFQPGVTTAWLSGIATHFDSLAASQAAVATTVSALLLIITYLLVKIFGFKWGMITGYFLALNPFLIAHSRVLHTDALLALFILVGLLAILVSDSKNLRYLVLSGIALGLAVLTKIFALGILPAAGLIILWRNWKETKIIENVLRVGMLWVGVIILTIFIAWPVMWLNAGEALSYLWDNITDYSGGRRTGEVSTHWWYYFREGFLRLTALVTVLAVIGFIGLLKEKNQQVRLALVALMLAGLSYAFLLSLKGDNADRYILITLLMFDLWAAFGLKTLIDWISREWKSALVTNILIASPIILLVALALSLHPYYLAHYNRLFPLNEQTYKLGWGEGLEQAANWVAGQSQDATVVTFYARVFKHFYEEEGGTGHVDTLEHLGENTNFIVIYRSMFERGPDDVATDFINNYLGPGSPEPVHVININGLDYVWIFAHSPLT